MKKVHFAKKLLIETPVYQTIVWTKKSWRWGTIKFAKWSEFQKFKSFIFNIWSSLIDLEFFLSFIFLFDKQLFQVKYSNSSPKKRFLRNCKRLFRDLKFHGTFQIQTFLKKGYIVILCIVSHTINSGFFSVFGVFMF